MTAKKPLRSFEHSVIHSSFVIRISSLALLFACASPPPPKPALPDPSANLTLDQLPNRPVLAGVAHRDSLPPVDALVSYAQGIDQLLRHHPLDAIEALRQAVRIDPNSHEAYWALGEAEFDRDGAANQRSIDAFEHAASLRPDDLDVHLLLARQCIVIDDRAAALRHLRLASQTSQYATDSAAAASVDLLLARVLQQDGFSRAALDEYLRLQQRLANPTEEIREDPDLGYLLSSPRWLQQRIARLCDEMGRYQQALDAWQPLADADPTDFDYQADVVEALSKLGRDDQAVRQAADLAQRFDVMPQSLDLLEEVCLAGGYDQAVSRLKALRRDQPANAAVILALADLWDSHGHAGDARRLLQNAAEQNPGDPAVLRKLCDFYAAHGDPVAGPRLLIEQSAAHPQLFWRIEPVFDALTRPTRAGALRPAMLEKIDVPPAGAAARLYLLSRDAAVWHRDALARDSIQAAVKLQPPFAPAFFAALDAAALDPDSDPDARAAAAGRLVDIAQSAGDADLAVELRGRMLCFQKKFAAAADLLRQSVDRGDASPTLRMTYAAALDALHQTDRYHQVLRGVTAQYPRFTQAWEALHDSFVAANQNDQAQAVLANWLAADPSNPSARLLQAQWNLRLGHLQSAEDGLARLLDDDPDDPDVLANIEGIYSQLNRTDAFVSRLQEIHQREPGNLTIADALVGALAASHPAQAARALDQARAALGDDPDLLYQLALLYHEISQKQVYQQVLAQVLKAAPDNAPANNDLGYCWADAGIHLDRAEQMIRQAVAAEPDNQAYLDSLGWVLYKQGKFTEAARWFQQAITPPELPDPEILDHFGDDLYRMGRPGDAAAQWQRSLEQLRIRPVEEQTELRLHVQRKLQDARLGQPVNVAPTVSGDVGDSAHRNQ